MSERYTFDNADIYDGDKPLRDTDLIDRLNEQEDDNDRLITINTALLAACMNFVWLGNNLHNIKESPDQFEQFYRSALDDVLAAIAKARP